ncbi:hypothetical protein LCGC14_0695810 [marine sediment metagenome]
MKNSKIIPGSLVAVATLLSGLTFAAAQTATETAPVQVEENAQTAKMTRADFSMDRSGRGAGRMLGQIMQQADANGDGALTQPEIDTFRAGLVEGADSSGEGNISLDEFEAIYLDLSRNRMVDAFQKLDADGDGVVTQAEMDNRFGNVVERMDRNDDGQLDREDRHGRDGKGHGRDGGRHGDRRG